MANDNPKRKQTVERTCPEPQHAQHESGCPIDATEPSYLFALDGVIGFTIYLLFTSPKQLKPQRSEDASAWLLVLRMEHRELLQHINLIIWGIVVVFTGAVVAALIPRITSLQATPTQLEASGLMLVNHAILIIYFLIGAWFGIIVQLLSRLEKIRKNALDLAISRQHPRT